MATTAKPPIAPDVADVIGEYAQNVENRSLLLDKFVLHKSWPPVFLGTASEPMRLDDASRWSFIRMAQNGEEYLQREKNGRESKRDRAERDGKRDKVEEHQACIDVLKCLCRCACRKLPGDLSALKLRQNCQFAHAMSQRPGPTAVVYGELQGRLIVNLSDSLIQNAGICLDRNTGLPYIPGSAVKGVSRHAALARLRNGEWSIKDFMKVFGSSEADFKAMGELEKFAECVPEEGRTLKGRVDFLAAVPITEPTIVVDISNVHYPEYYQSGMPADLQKENPKPNTFPAVEKGVRYAFCIAANCMETVDDELFAKARDVLVEAITVSGIGAKTGAGYGWFKDVTAEVEADEKRKAEIEKASRAEEERRAAEAAARAEANARAERRAALSPRERILEEWDAAANMKAIVNGRYIAQFSTLSDADRQGVVEALREPEGIGAKVWVALKGEIPKKKQRNPNAEQEIRAYCKNTLKQGKMP